MFLSIGRGEKKKTRKDVTHFPGLFCWTQSDFFQKASERSVPVAWSTWEAVICFGSKERSNNLAPQEVWTKL